MCGTAPAERRLVLAALAGETTAFEELVNRCRRSVVATASVYLRDRNDAEDVAQEALAKAYVELRRLRPPFRFGAWVRQIARNLARNAAARRPRMAPLESAGEPAARDCPDIAAREAAERAERIRSALSALTPPLREVVRLAYLGGYSVREIREKLDVPAGTVRRRLFDGRRMIRAGEARMSTRATDGQAGLVPSITIETIPGRAMRVPVRGYGGLGGSVLEVGDIEVKEFYDYPGGIYTGTTRTEVKRRLTILDRECFECACTNSDCEPPEPNQLLYFEVTDAEIRWVLRITADDTYPEVDPEVITEEPEKRRDICHPPAGAGEAGRTRVVRLRVGDTDRGECLEETWFEEGCAYEDYRSPDGRLVLHRHYVGPEAPGYPYDKLTGAPRKTIEDREYRLWYDVVLAEP